MHPLPDPEHPLKTQHNPDFCLRDLRLSENYHPRFYIAFMEFWVAPPEDGDGGNAGEMVRRTSLPWIGWGVWVV